MTSGTPVTTPPPATQRPGSFAVLRLPTYRRFLAAAICQSVAMWTFQTVLIWVILEQTGAGSSVSLLLISLTVAWLLWSLPAGVLADRYDLRRMMLVGQLFGAVAMAATALATATGNMSLLAGMVAMFAMGFFDSFTNVPAMVFVGRLVDPKLMAGAIGLSALQYGVGRIAGGLLTGVAIAAIGAGPTIAVAGGLLAVAAILVATLPSLPRLETSPGRAGLGDLTTAIRWFRGSAPSLAMMTLGIAAAIFVYSYFTLLPIVARDVLGAGAQGLGFLTSAGGAGILIASLLTDIVGRRFGRGRAVVVSLVLATLAFAGLGLSTWLPLSLLFVTAMTVFLGIYRVTSQMVLQHVAPARMRGRVLAVFELSFWGIYPVGTIAAGTLADGFGAPAVIVSFAVLTLVATGAALLWGRSLLQLDIDRDGQVVLDRRLATGPPAGEPRAAVE